MACLLTLLLVSARKGNSRAVAIVQGVPQGDPLSPFIFHMYMDTLLARLNTNEPLLGSCVVDDVLLLAESDDPMRQALLACSTWAAEHGMQWSAHKSHVLTVGEFLLSGCPVPTSESVEYLGVTLRPPASRPTASWTVSDRRATSFGAS